jgi:hypothetical protein
MKNNQEQKGKTVLLEIPQELHSDLKITAIRKGMKLYSYMQHCLVIGNKELKKAI